MSKVSDSCLFQQITRYIRDPIAYKLLQRFETLNLSAHFYAMSEIGPTRVLFDFIAFPTNPQHRLSIRIQEITHDLLCPVAQISTQIRRQLVIRDVVQFLRLLLALVDRPGRIFERSGGGLILRCLLRRCFRNSRVNSTIELE